MKRKRDIPPEVFRHWANCFIDGTLDDEYADELGEILELLANNAEFNEELKKNRRAWYEGSIH